MKQIEQTISSIEVAEMVGKRHDHLIRDIKKYIGEMSAPNFGEGAELKIEPGDFFKESTYKDANNQKRPCYDVTKKGCEFIAHKLTGVKGTEFTAKYINRFHDMEDALKEQSDTMIQFQELSPELQAIFAHDKKIQQISSRVDAVNKDLQQFKEDMPILGIEESKITNAVKKKGVNCLGGKSSNAYNDRKLRTKLYMDIYRQLYRQFGIATYRAIRRNQCDMAIKIIEDYDVPYILGEQIHDCNAQVNMEIPGNET